MKTIEELEARLEVTTRERDEARAEVARLRREVDAMAAELHALSVRYDARDNDSADAHRRGAEVMREACAQHLEHAPRPIPYSIRALPIPEEP